MTSAVIVSTARTPAGQELEGRLQHDPRRHAWAATPCSHAVQRAGIDPALVEDVIMGCANPEGATGMNIARQIALVRRLPVTASGMTINRFCSSACRPLPWPRNASSPVKRDVYVAGGRRKHLCVQQEMNKHMIDRPWPASEKPRSTEHAAETAENGAKRYGIGRDVMDDTAPPASKRPAPPRLPACSTPRSRRLP